MFVRIDFDASWLWRFCVAFKFSLVTWSVYINATPAPILVFFSYASIDMGVAYYYAGVVRFTFSLFGFIVLMLTFFCRVGQRLTDDVPNFNQEGEHSATP